MEEEYKNDLSARLRPAVGVRSDRIPEAPRGARREGTTIDATVKSQVDQVWNAFWSGGIANPLNAIEQMTYLLFIRRLDEVHTREENRSNATGQPMRTRVFPEGSDDTARRARPYDDLRWSRFKNFTPAEMFDVVE